MGKSQRVIVKRSFTRKPYLSWIDDPATTMTIRYATNTRDADQIFYGDGTDLNTSSLTNSGNEKEVTLRGLNPGSVYRYRIGQTGEVYHFATAPRGYEPFSFAVYGDYSELGNKATKLRLYRLIEQDHPAFLLFTGDIVSNGNQPGKWKTEFFGTIGAISPYYPLMAARGNHDGTGSLFNYYFRYPENKRWYSFSYGNALFISLDTQGNYSPGSTQYSFLINTLQQTNAEWKFVYLHKPPYSTNGRHGSDLKVRRVLCPVFEQYGVDVVFCGHNHCYERTRPLRQNKVDSERGVIYITTGGGGALLSPFIPLQKLSRLEKKWTFIRRVSHHYLLARIEANRLVILAKNPNGKTIDRMELSLDSHDMTATRS